MNQFTLSKPYQLHITCIDNAFIDQYFAKASGEQLKVMIMLMRLIQGDESFSTETLAKKLDMTEGAVNRALKYWQEEGLLKEEDTKETAASVSQNLSKPDTPEKKLLSSAQLKKKDEDKQFMDLKYIAEMYFNHPMTAAELNSLSYIYDTLKLPVDLIEYLIEYCVSNHKTSWRYIEKVAISWHEQNITTPAQAKSAAASYQKEYYQILKAMGLSGKPTPAQIEYMERWLYKDAMSMNLILEACRRTTLQTGDASFPYAASILESWKKNNIRTLTDVAAADQRFAASKNTASENASMRVSPKVAKQIHNFNERSYNFDELEQRYIEQINQ
ncbi:MAG: DnaD domain protein [Lachnospiraceae bacterium]|nr:DnaD domain protein [Lachnospiraceae bacterium]